MEGSTRRVDVISVCSADGQIRPLRLRIDDPSLGSLRADITGILDAR